MDPYDKGSSSNNTDKHTNTAMPEEVTTLHLEQLSKSADRPADEQLPSTPFYRSTHGFVHEAHYVDLKQQPPLMKSRPPKSSRHYGRYKQDSLQQLCEQRRQTKMTAPRLKAKYSGEPSPKPPPQQQQSTTAAPKLPPPPSTAWKSDKARDNGTNGENDNHKNDETELLHGSPENSNHPPQHMDSMDAPIPKKRKRSLSSSSSTMFQQQQQQPGTRRETPIDLDSDHDEEGNDKNNGQSASSRRRDPSQRRDTDVETGDQVQVMDDSTCSSATGTRSTEDGYKTRALVEQIEQQSEPGLISSVRQSLGDFQKRAKSTVTSISSNFFSSATRDAPRSTYAPTKKRKSHGSAKKIIPGISLLSRGGSSTNSGNRRSTFGTTKDKNQNDIDARQQQLTFQPVAPTMSTRSSARKAKRERQPEEIVIHDSDDDMKDIEQEVCMEYPFHLWGMPRLCHRMYYLTRCCLLFFYSNFDQVTTGPMLVARIAIGPRVARRDCFIELKKGGHLVMNFCLPSQVVRRSSRRRHAFGDDASRMLEISLKNELQQVCFYLCPSDHDVDAGHGSFLAISTSPSATKVIQKFCKEYNPGSQDQADRFIVIEFNDSSRLDEFLGVLRQLPVMQRFLEGGQLNGLDAKEFCSPLVNDAAASEVRELEERTQPEEIWAPEFLLGRDDNDVLLVYPFSGDKNEIESAAQGLVELADFGVSHDAAKESAQDQSEKDEEINGIRTHYLTISVADCKRLEPGVYLNDTLIDFFMRW